MSLDQQDMALAAALSSRICHDLVSPVGAIVNGVDLINEIGGGNHHDELAMINQSAQRASCLLEFYRIAFGSVTEGAAPVGRGHLAEKASRMLTTPRITLDWTGNDGPELARREARLAAQILLCARAVTGMSGLISVEIDPNESFPMQITISGDGITRGADLLDALAGGPMPEMTPRVIEFALARQSSEALGVTIDVHQNPGEAVLTIK